MAWLKIHQSIRQHKKILEAADTLEIAPPYMIGLLTSFWLWALDNVPSGDITGISTKNIARAAGWDGNADDLFNTLVDAGLIDEIESQEDDDTHLYLIHDWEEYAGSLIQQREAEKERSRRRRSTTWSTGGRPADDHPVDHMDDHRSTDKRPPVDHTDDHPVDRQTTAGRVEKSRVEKNNNIYKAPLSASPDSPDDFDDENDGGAMPKMAHERADPTPYAKIMQLYNTICVSFPKIQKIDGARRKAVAARFRSYPDLEYFEKLFKKTEASSFMKGGNSKNWTADFDWIIKASNMCKVLEGKYDNKGGANSDAIPGNKYKLTGFTPA